MTQEDAPWAIGGISEQARAAAIAAARANGTSVGAWLERAIREATAPAPRTYETSELAQAARILASARQSEERSLAAIAPLQEAVAKLLHRLEALETAGGRRPAQLAGDRS